MVRERQMMIYKQCICCGVMYLSHVGEILSTMLETAVKMNSEVDNRGEFRYFMYIVYFFNITNIRNDTSHILRISTTTLGM